MCLVTMSKILIVGLLQVVLAQYNPNARPYVNTDNYRGQQFDYRYPENRNFEERSQDMRLRTENFNNHRPYTEYNENVYRNDREPFIYERTATNNNKYTLSEDPASYNYNREVDNGEANNFGRKNHRVIDNTKDEQYRTSDEQDTDYSDMGSQSNTRLVNYDQIGTEYNTEGNRQQISQDHVRTTTDTEARLDNRADGRDEGDSWIWDAKTSTTTNTERKSPEADLFDRVAFDASKCRKNEAKVRGICFERHKK